VDDWRRAISPVLGVLLMVALTLVLASVFASGALTAGEGLGEKRDQFDETVARTPVSTATGNPWAGDRGDLIRPANTQAGATDVEYRVNFTIEPGSDTIGNSLNSVYIEVTTGSPPMFANTAREDLQRVVVDEGSDGTVDQVITGDVNGWTVQNGGTALKIEFTGAAYTPQADDSIVVEFDGVDNPDTAGSYDLRAQTSGDGNWHTGTISIV
jgi:flagellin-like protein